MKNKKKCLCGETYTLSEFQGLEFAYNQYSRYSDAFTNYLEVRHCACGSTIALAVGRDGKFYTATDLDENYEFKWLEVK